MEVHVPPVIWSEEVAKGDLRRTVPEKDQETTGFPRPNIGFPVVMSL